MSNFKEVTPGGRPFKKVYLSIMLWFVGRAIQAGAKVDKDLKKEFSDLPDNFTFAMGVAPDGPQMIVGKKSSGTVKYLGSKTKDNTIDLNMTIKSIEAAFLLFTFQESTTVATARDRLVVDGGIPEACAVVRIMDIIEVYLLPKFITKLAVKRYPKWTLKRHTINRLLVNIRAIAGI